MCLAPSIGIRIPVRFQASSKRWAGTDGFRLVARRHRLKGRALAETCGKLNRNFREGAVRLAQETGKAIAQGGPGADLLAIRPGRRPAPITVSYRGSSDGTARPHVIKRHTDPKVKTHPGQPAGRHQLPAAAGRQTDARGPAGPGHPVHAVRAGCPRSAGLFYDVAGTLSEGGST
jgi:hypothetical protein